MNLTRRWNKAQMKDVGDWADGHIRKVRITLGTYSEAMEFEVRKFIPREGDVLDRNWVDGTVQKSKRLEPYGFADIHKACESYKSYIEKHALEAMAVDLATRESDPLIQETFAWAHRRCRSLLVSPVPTSRTKSEKSASLSQKQTRRDSTEDREVKFMGDLFKLWFAISECKIAPKFSPPWAALTPE